MNKLDLIQLTVTSISPDELRFWSYTDMSGECWEWTKATNMGGYGLFSYQGKTRLAHRLAWFFAYGEVLSSEVLLRHVCDNPRCVRPTHLIPGTNADNAQDKRDRDRFPKTQKRLPLDERSAMIEIYQAGRATQRTLAEAFGISIRQAQNILSETRNES